MGPNDILQRVGMFAYELKLPIELTSINLVFHVYMLKNSICDLESNLPIERLCVKDNLCYEEVSVKILDRKVKKLRNKEVVSINVL